MRWVEEGVCIYVCFRAGWLAVGIQKVHRLLVAQLDGLDRAIFIDKHISIHTCHYLLPKHFEVSYSNSGKHTAKYIHD